MSKALRQLAYIAGGVMALIVLAVSLMRDFPLETALFRASVALCAGSIVVAFFFYRFTALLYEFLKEKQHELQNEAKTNKGAAPPVAESRPRRTAP